MNKVFVYGTLRKENILEDALGKNHGKSMSPATASGFVEKNVLYDHESWPTLQAMGPKASVSGDTIEVTDEELKKLDDWEQKYYRKRVTTDQGPAWAFVFTPPHLKRALNG